jgi:Glycosyltransferases involved in cell wall biogenesis
MNSKFLVSVIMPCYNASSYLKQSIESVLAQTYPNWELILVDDASTDNSLALAEKFSKQDSRIRCFAQNANSGIAATRNKALDEAKGRFVAFLDNDDLWHPRKLEIQVQWMLEKQIAFSYTAYNLMNANGSLLGKSIATAGNLQYNDYLKNTIIGCGTVMLDIQKVGKVRMPDYRTSEDMALWLSILHRGFVAYAIDEVLMTYRLRPNSASANKWKAAKDVWMVYRKHEQLSVFQSLYNFCGYVFNSIKKRVR